MENILEKRMYDVSKATGYIEIILISLGAFLTPLILPELLKAIFSSESVIANNSQYVVGTIVNTSLIIAGINVKGWKKILGIITLPSISAILSSSILNTSSIYTVYMIPAIWIGNFLIVYLYRYLFVNKNKNYLLSSIISIIIKASVIFIGFNLLSITNIIPSGPIFNILFTAMGINQIITAILGSIIAFIIIKTFYKKVN